MLKVDTSGEYAQIQAKGDAEEIGKDLITIIASLAGAISRDGIAGKVNAMMMLKIIGLTVSSDEFIESVVEDGKLNDGVVSISPIEGETEEQTMTRAKLAAMQKFTKARPIKVDGDYNIIDEESEDEEE